MTTSTMTAVTAVTVSALKLRTFVSLIKLLLGAFSIVTSSIADSKGGCLNRQALINVCELIAANIKQVSFQPYSLINNSLTGDRTNKPKPDPETAIPIIFFVL